MILIINLYITIRIRIGSTKCKIDLLKILERKIIKFMEQGASTRTKILFIPSSIYQHVSLFKTLECFLHRYIDNITLNGKCWTTEAFQSPRFISRKLLQRLLGWHWRSRPVDSVGNVANVVTECHRAPSKEDRNSWGQGWRRVGEERRKGVGDISSLGKLERGPWCLEDEVGYLSPVGATSRPSSSRKARPSARMTSSYP